MFTTDNEEPSAMSAWIVSQAHIDVLVQGLCEGEHVTDLDPDEVGSILWGENHASVNYRYSEDTPTPEYAYRRPGKRIDPSGLLYAIGCYQYQSCEHPGWEHTIAYAWTTRLRDALEAHPGVDANPPFGRYPWGYDEDDVHGSELSR